MSEVATWIRDSDEPLFAQFHGRHSGICIANACLSERGSLLLAGLARGGASGMK